VATTIFLLLLLCGVKILNCTVKKARVRRLDRRNRKGRDRGNETEEEKKTKTG